jgi:hypothetical protein
MKSTINDQFRRLFARLPGHVQQQAREAYKLFKQNPHHPSLHFKQIRSSSVYSIRITRGYRALGDWEGDEITWYWIGTHSDYDKLIGRL